MIDSGCGIKKEDQGKLFQLFGFLETTKSINTKGIGLGLHISKKIVTEFGGSVDVKSSVGIGSEFSFTFMLEKCVREKTLSIRRIKNPEKNSYSKIIVSSDEESFKLRLSHSLSERVMSRKNSGPSKQTKLVPENRENQLINLTSLNIVEEEKEIEDQSIQNKIL